MSENYWEVREQLKKVIPRQTRFFEMKDKNLLKEKGRKKNYHEFNLETKEYVKSERLLNTETISSFLEVSLRAQSCPMPLNIDVWDGINCPYKCRYCYADYFKHSLYTSFFDNHKDIGFRHCDPTFYKNELDKIMKHRGSCEKSQDKVINAIRLEIPMRLGIRYEDFAPIEKKKGISLQLLEHLAELNYPVMINTKSDLVGEDSYVKALSDNKGKTAVHVTLISSDNELLKKIEPGAPSFEKRISGLKNLSSADIRAVARIEPFMVFVNDEKDRVDEYIGYLKEAGVDHVTWDTYSYSANSVGIADNFAKVGYDFERMFLLSSDSQAVSSYMMGLMMKYFQLNGIQCSTFDAGNVSNNNDDICCSVGDWFEGGFNYGCGTMAIRYIQKKKRPIRWSHFERYVINKGGFLSEDIKQEVKNLWNLQGNAAWFLNWAQGIEPVGHDQDGIIWMYKDYDFRKRIIEGVLQ